jgi:hypothetical protein
MLSEGAYAWRCTLCEAAGYGGPSAFTTHYETAHTPPPPTNHSLLAEARNQPRRRGAAADQWAHSAWNEYEANQ